MSSDKSMDNFKREYYERIDFEYWLERLLHSWRRYNSIKTNKLKARCLVDIYSIYMQLCEVLVIHMHSLSYSNESFVATLGISNAEIVDFARKVGENSTYLRNFTENFIYKIRGLEINNDDIELDVRILKEVLEDYLSNRSFLNSYKHGFRVNSSHGDNYVAIGLNPNEMYKVVGGDSSISYFETIFKKGEFVSLNETNITFKHTRVYGNSLFLACYLMNVRLSVLKSLGLKGKVQYPKFYITNIDGWRESIGKTRFTNPLFTVVKK